LENPTVGLWLCGVYYKAKDMFSGNSQCNFYKTCVDCRDDPECGWCDDGSGTGLGSCMAGGNTPPQSCSQNKWYFTHCPSEYIYIYM